MRQGFQVFAVAGLLLGVVACGDPAPEGAAPPARGTTSPTAPATAAASAGTPTATGSPAATGTGTVRTIGDVSYSDRGTVDVSGRSELAVALENFAFAPTFIQGQPGQKLTLQLANDSAARHNVSIPAQGIDVDLAANGRATVEVTMPESGAVLMFCKFHLARGMNAQLMAGTGQPQPLAPAGTPGRATATPTPSGSDASSDYGY